MMTHFNENMEHYVEKTIEDFYHTIEYAEKKTVTGSRTADKDYALWSIEGSLNRAQGALSFSHCYTKTIDDKTYNRLNDRLMKEYFDAQRKVRDSKILKWREK